MIIPKLVRDGIDFDFCDLAEQRESRGVSRFFFQEVGNGLTSGRSARSIDRMALFPKCTFEVLVTGGVLRAGTRVEGVLVVTAPEAIPRAESIELVFESVAWAGYGGGKNRSVDRRVMFRAPLHVDVPAGVLAAGTHRFPYSIDLPSWLPPAFGGNDCAIEHTLEARVDVDWAVDPVVKLRPAIEVAPREGTRLPITTRSPGNFHESIVLEVTLASSVIAHDEPLTGQIALRSGHDARFDAVELQMAGAARIVMGLKDRRLGGGSMIRIPAQSLRSGEAVPFQFPPNAHLQPSFRSSFIDHEVILTVKVDIPWAADPSFPLMLDVLPPGSTLHGGAGASIVGGERLRRIASVMAESTGLREGHAPTFVEGDVAGPVHVRISDAPRDGRLGIDIDIVFPDVELGIDFGRSGCSRGFAARRCCLPPSPSATCSAAEAVTAALPSTTPSSPGSSAFSSVTWPSTSRSVSPTTTSASTCRSRTTSCLAWSRSRGQRTPRRPPSSTRSPGFPSLKRSRRRGRRGSRRPQSRARSSCPPAPRCTGSRSARVCSTERSGRSAQPSARSGRRKGRPLTSTSTSAGHRYPRSRGPRLESETPSERMRAVRALFPSARVMAQGNGATLDRPEWTPDPRALLAAIETFFAWVLEARGERRQDLPYR